MSDNLREEIEAVRILKGEMTDLEKRLATITQLRKNAEKVVKRRTKLYRVEGKSTKNMQEALKRVRLETVEVVKEQEKQVEVIKEVAEETDELTKRIERINNVNTEFSKRTKILSEAIARQAITNTKGFNLGMQSFRAYQEAGGNAFEYLAEFISSAREEVQIFGMEAAKLRKVMYGFLPAGTFRVLNKFSSVLQFTGGMLRNLRDDAEDIEGPLKKLFSGFLKFGKIPRKFPSVRGLFPKEMPKLVKHRKELLAIEEQLAGLSDEDRAGEKGDKLRKRQTTVTRQIGLMEDTETQKMFNEFNKVTKDVAQFVGTIMGGRGQTRKGKAREEMKRIDEQSKSLAAELIEAQRINDTVLVKEIGEQLNVLKEKREEQQEIFKQFGRKEMIARKSGIESQQFKLAKKRDKKGLSKKEELTFQKNEEDLAVIKEELGKANFMGLGKSIYKFVNYSMSRKAKQIQEGATKFFKNIVPTLKMVLMGFLQAFVYISLIIVAIYFIKKFFENNSGVLEKVTGFLESTYNFFMENIYPILEEGVQLVKKAFGKDGDLIDLLEGLLLIGAGILATAVVALGAAVIAILYTLYEAARKYLTDKFNEVGGGLAGIWKVAKILLGVAAAIALLVSFGWVPLLAVAMAAAVYKAFRRRKKDETGQAMARGGLVTSNLQLVGEEGPELVSIPQGSRVRTASQTRAALANNNQTVNNFNITINAKDTSRAEMRRIADEIGKMVNSKINRSVSSRTLG